MAENRTETRTCPKCSLDMMGFAKKYNEWVCSACSARFPADETGDGAVQLATLEDQIKERFHCAKCETEGCLTKRIATTGAGLSRLFDVQNNFFLVVVCKECAHAEFYDLNLLEGKGGWSPALLDVLFGTS